MNKIFISEVCIKLVALGINYIRIKEVLKLAV